MRWMKLNSQTISQKAGVIVEHFHDNVAHVLELRRCLGSSATAFCGDAAPQFSRSSRRRQHGYRSRSGERHASRGESRFGARWLHPGRVANDPRRAAREQMLYRCEGHFADRGVRGVNQGSDTSQDRKPAM